MDTTTMNKKLGEGVKFERIRRITGYLVGTTDRWNHGKLSELNDRVTHIDNGNQLELFDRL